MTDKPVKLDPSAGVLIEAEAFDDFGGWVLDSQFETLMGSPYLMAHGLGEPVADATTTIDLRASGDYQVWVRAKDWVPGHHPGRFELSINDERLDTVFGANDQDWSWQAAGSVSLQAGPVKLALHDLTGFCGRCDRGADPRPSGAWRQREQRDWPHAARGARRAPQRALAADTGWRSRRVRASRGGSDRQGFPRAPSDRRGSGGQ